MFPFRDLSGRVIGRSRRLPNDDLNGTFLLDVPFSLVGAVTLSPQLPGH